MSDAPAPPTPPPAPPTPPTPPPDPPNDPDALPSDAGELASLVRELRRESAGQRQKLRDVETQRDRAVEKTKSEAERALDDARKEGAGAARKELESEMLEMELRAAAGGRMRDPEDAVLRLREQLAGRERGVERSRAIAKAIDALLEEKPYLAAENGSSSSNGLGQGARSSRDGAAADDWLRRARRSTRA